MRLTDKAIENINNEYRNIKKEKTESNLNINIQSSLNGISIFTNSWQLVNLEDLNQAIEDLTDMKKAIEKATGIIL